MAGYTRQRDSNISNGSVINADDFDAEYNAVEAAFNSSTGHKHDGTAGEGAPIEKVGPAQDLVVSSSQVIPKTTSTLDLGSAAVQFQNAWFNGTVDTDTLAVSDNTTMGGTLDVTGTITGNVTGGLTGDVTGDLTGDVTGNVTGNLTGDVTGDVTSTGTSTFSTVEVDGGNIDNTAIGANTASTVTGTTITANTGFVGAVEGDVTGNADTATAWQTARSLTLTGDVTGTVSGIDGSGNISVATTVTAVEPDSVALGTDTTGDYVSSLVGGTGVTVGDAGEGATPTIAIGQVVNTDSDVQFNNIIVDGNLTVAGETTTVLSNDVNIADRIITLNSDETGAPSQDAGIVIERGTADNKSFIWDESEDEWSTKGERLKASTFEGALDGNASTATALETSRTIAGQGFDGTDDISIAPTDLTGVTASAAALNTASSHYVPTGGIIMWSGSIASIPTGWALCNGDNNTPNLMDRFVVGAGNDHDVDDADGGTATLTEANLPAHNHSATSTSTSTVHDPGHSHPFAGVTACSGGGDCSRRSEPTTRNTSSATTGITVSTSTSTTIGNTGSGTAFNIVPKYYALAYIMKT